MFRILIVLFFTLVQSSDDIKAISYNIRYNNPKDGMNIWENRKATVMGLLNEQSADFVGLQEVVHAQLLDLVEGLPTYNYVGIGRKDGKTKGEYSPIFLKKTNIAYCNPTHFGCPRPPTWFPRAGMPLWNAFAPMDCLKTKKPTKSLGF